MQRRLREELAKQDEYNTWGLQNFIIELQIKVRMTVDIIDMAQRVQV